MTDKHTNNQTPEKPNDFGRKYGNRKRNVKAEWINKMTRELEGLEEGLKAEINIELHKKTLKRYQTGKRQDMMEYTDSGSRNSPPFTTD